MSEAAMVMNNHSNNLNDEWYTPQKYIEAAREVMGEINLDPASNEAANQVVDADNYYSLENSAFDNEWFGKVWMNPPYSRIIKLFAHKLVEEFEAGRVTEAVVVTNNGTDTQWFHKMGSVASAFCLHKGRIGFINETGDQVQNNNKGQIFTYLGSNPERFKEVFSEFGLVVTK